MPHKQWPHGQVAGAPYDLEVKTLVNPQMILDNFTGPAVDLVAPSGEYGAIQSIGQFQVGTTWHGVIQQSADQVNWTPIPDGVLADVTAPNVARVTTFTPTQRYVRYVGTVTNGPPQIDLCVVLLKANVTG